MVSVAISTELSTAPVPPTTVTLFSAAAVVSLWLTETAATHSHVVWCSNVANGSMGTRRWGGEAVAPPPGIKKR